MLTTSKSSHRLSLLLKTLLILLCIYIKRVTAAPTGPEDPSKCIKPGHDVTQIYTYEEEISEELRCPVEDLVKSNAEVPKMRRALESNATLLHQFEKKLKKMKKKIIDSTQIYWLKHGIPQFRDNGNPVLERRLAHNESKAILTILMVGQSDAGSWSCELDYDNLPDGACQYFTLISKFDFEVIVRNKNDLPDIKPTISHPPDSKLVRRGENVTFECKIGPSLSQPATVWFKSNCTPSDDPECLREFKIHYGEMEKDGNRRYIEKHVLKDQCYNELTLNNVDDADMGYYGCLVHNNKGFDVRLGYLNLIEVELRKRPINLTHEDSSGKHKYPKLVASTNGTTNFHSTNHTAEPATSQSTNRYSNEHPNLTIAHIRENPRADTSIGSHYLLYVVIILSLTLFLYVASDQLKNCIKSSDESMRQHLPTADCPDIYNIGKSTDGFISGLLAHNNDQFLSGSVCSRLLQKEKNPSISSNSNSDEASSWGKSMSSHGDNCRAFYLHTSNTTATTVPLYDHPPSTGTARICKTMVQDACIINPTYGLLQPIDSDALDWSFPRRNLERLNKIGEGQFGEVWRYIARQKDGSDSLVAVKQLKNRVGYGQRERLELIAEIEIMKLVNEHPNVIKLLNYCSDDFEPLLLIMEYAENGKLQTYLRNCRSYRKSYSCLSDFRTIITSKELVKFAYHIAKGMEYVASKGIIHRDLASRNILVSKDMVCKVADFGFARRVNDDCAYERSTANPVPVKWMAPEALVENKFTSKSDVFSFGILMWEIVTLGATPYESMASSEVYRKVTSGGRLERPAHCKEEFYHIMASCWLHDPTRRPTFKELAAQLEKLLISENDYIELDQYPEHAYYNILNTAEKEVVHI